MLKRLRFAFVYALRNMLRNRQRTFFALFSIAAGVATVVALRALGLMLTDALTSNAQGFLRGDVRVQTFGEQVRISAIGDGGNTDLPFTAATIAQIDKWAVANGYEVTYATSRELFQLSRIDENGKSGPPIFASSSFIDPQVYPFYNVLSAEEPQGVELKALLAQPDTVVVSRRIANQAGLRVGDKVRLSATDVRHTVTGIVPDTAESIFDNPNIFLFGFIYLDRANMAAYGMQAGMADRAYVKAPPGTSLSALENDINRSWPKTASYRSWQTTTADEILRNNQMVADAVSRFVLLLSLVGLVIGGVGIINTMIVSVNRRSGEIAVLKTLGLKGRGVTLIFLVEALLLGIFGSLVGVVFGYVLSFLSRSLGEQAFSVPLPWKLYLDPILIGVALGVAITMFFSFLPTLMAGQIRPGLVLRQGNIPMARAGCLPSLVSVLLLVVGIGLLVDVIIGSQRFNVDVPAPLTLGIVGTFVVFLLLGIILAMMWVVVWLLGKLPAFRSPNMRIALRGLTQHRSRTALSLTALIIGMSALSGTLIMTRSINILLYTSISDPLGGNVIVLPLLPVEGIVGGKLQNTEGVKGYRQVRFGSGMRLMAVDGDRNFRRKLSEDTQSPASMSSMLLESVIGSDVYGNPRRGTLVDGRFLTPEDGGEFLIVVPYTPDIERLGVKVGSVFTYRMQTNSSGRTTEQTFTVVGLVRPEASSGVMPFSLSDSAVQTPLNTLPKMMPFDFIIVDAETDKVADVMSAAAVPGAFVFDVGVFDSILSRILNQMAALPLLVAILSLVAATALIASTVSLATIERRRQIGILKAVGVKRRQALVQLLIENGLVGVAGGILSLLPTVLILALVPALTEGIVSLPVPYDLIGLMLALAIGITLAATLVTAWGASGERPLTVLRYE